MTTVRIFFEKCGESAYISLLDLQRVFHRMLKMSSLPVYYTQVFNPHIYLSFTCPLSLGQESLCESCEVKTEQETIDPQAWIDALQPLMPRGIVITKVAPAVEKVGEIETAAYEITMPAGSAIALDAYNNAEHAEVTKKTKRGCKTLELKHYLDHIEYTIEGGTLRKPKKEGRQGADLTSLPPLPEPEEEQQTHFEEELRELLGNGGDIIHKFSSWVNSLMENFSSKDK